MQYHAEKSDELQECLMVSSLTWFFPNTSMASMRYLVQKSNVRQARLMVRSPVR